VNNIHPETQNFMDCNEIFLLLLQNFVFQGSLFQVFRVHSKLQGVIYIGACAGTYIYADSKV